MTSITNTTNSNDYFYETLPPVLKDIVVDYLRLPELPNLEDQYTLVKARKWLGKPLKGTNPRREEAANKLGLNKEQMGFAIVWAQKINFLRGEPDIYDPFHREIGFPFYSIRDLKFEVIQYNQNWGFDNLLTKIVETSSACLCLFGNKDNILNQLLILDNIDININRKLDLARVQYWGDSPIVAAVENRDEGMVKDLLAFPNIDLTSKYSRNGKTVLEFAEHRAKFTDADSPENRIVKLIKKRLPRPPSSSKPPTSKGCTIM